MFSCCKFSCFAQIAESSVSATSNKTNVDRSSLKRFSWSQIHVFISFYCDRFFAFGQTFGSGNGLSYSYSLAWGYAPSYRRFDLSSIKSNYIVVFCVAIALNTLPPSNCSIPVRSARGEISTFKIFVSSCIGVNVSATRTTFDRHITDSHPLFHIHGCKSRASIFVSVTYSSFYPQFADNM